MQVVVQLMYSMQAVVYCNLFVKFSDYLDCKEEKSICKHLLHAIFTCA